MDVYLSDESNDSDEFVEGLLKKALDVEFPANFNPLSIPRDGYEYIHHVMYERKNCQDIVTSDIDTDQFLKNQTITVPPTKSLVGNTLSKFLPSLEWQEKKLNDFKYFKEILESQDKIKLKPTITTFNEDGFIKKIETKAPTFSTMCQYKQPAKIRMLELLMKYISNKKLLTDSVGTWIFSILATLEIPLSPSLCHTIREFVRTCQVVRSTFSEEFELEDCDALNFYICIICRYFGQLDLADS